jgi:hypothetical protein
MAANSLDMEYRLEKITDEGRIMEYGVVVTPALVIDGDVAFSGEVPDQDKIRKAIKSK